MAIRPLGDDYRPGPKGVGRAIEEQIGLIVLDAEREIAQPDDFLAVRATAKAIGYVEPTTL
jgi:hypothetical protein